MNNLKDVTEFSDYKYRPKLDLETQNKLQDLRKNLGIENIPLNAVSNMLIKIGISCLEKAIPEMQTNLSDKIKNKFPSIIEILNS